MSIRQLGYCTMCFKNRAVRGSPYCESCKKKREAGLVKPEEKEDLSKTLQQRRDANLSQQEENS